MPTFITSLFNPETHLSSNFSLLFSGTNILLKTQTLYTWLILSQLYLQPCCSHGCFWGLALVPSFLDYYTSNYLTASSLFAL